jgi:hypothetical protein
MEKRELTNFEREVELTKEAIEKVDKIDENLIKKLKENKIPIEDIKDVIEISSILAYAKTHPQDLNYLQEKMEKIFG